MKFEDTLLSVENLSFGTPSNRVLAKKINIKLCSGELLVIKGPNGGGKSTFLKVLLGDQTPIRGSVSYHIEKSKIEYVPQLANIVFHIPVTLEDVLRIHCPSFRSDKSHKLLRKNQLNYAWNSASGGERKRTLLLRALLNHPSLLVLDEPLNHLDLKSKEVVAGVIADFLQNQTKEKRGVILVAHESVSKISQFSKIPKKELLIGGEL